MVDPRLTAEEAYRRGFAQGAHYVMREVDNGRSMKALRTWWHRIVRWRYALQRVRNIPTYWALPPEMAPMKKGGDSC
jgi:hypothetical protein